MQTQRTGFSFYRIAWLRLALLTAALLTASAAHGQDRPNVILILADDLGIGDLSCYGAEDLQSPHIDAIAASGVRFTNFYANASVCSPTRAAMLTGRYPERVGIPGVVRTNPIHNWGYLLPEAVMIGDVLKPVGYHSALVGKWHLGIDSPNKPNERGFDHFHGLLGDMMDDYWTHLRTNVNYLRLNEQVIDPDGHATTLFTDWAIEYLESRKDQDEPFFLYLAYTAPHSPIQPPPEWVDKVKAREPGIDDKRAKLVALIEHMDDDIGRVMRSLKDTGLADNTLVIFTSDNGGSLGHGANNGPWRGSKGSLWEGGLRVPLVASWPGRIAPGSESETVSITMDLFPTIAEVAGAAIHHEIDGVSIVRSLEGHTQEFDRDLAWMRLEGNRAMGRTFYAYRRGDWKIVQPNPFSEYQLYNLAKDPGEQDNVRGSKHKGRFWDMIRSMQVYIQEGGNVPWQAPAE